MKIKARVWMVLSIISIFFCLVLPVSNAETFDVGTKIADSDFNWYTFSLGAIVTTDSETVNYTYLIFDGNESTGLDHDFGPGNDYIRFKIIFPYMYYITNITVKPDFGGNASTYTLTLYYLGGGFDIITGANTERTLQINRTIDGLRLSLDSNGTNHFYFNDVIINYNPAVSNPEGVQDQVDYLTQQLNLLETRINELTNLIDELNQTQAEVIENVSSLYTTYYQLNGSFTNFINEITTLNNTVSQLQTENAAFKSEIDNLTAEIEKLKSEEEPVNILVYVAIILGILGVIIAIIALIMISKKLGSQISPIEKKESEDAFPSDKED